MINFDYASHTVASEHVLAEFCRAERECVGNAFAAHGLGAAARAELAHAKEGIAGLLGVASSEIIFTSGASEANNLAIKGIARAYAHAGRHILSTCLEHPSASGALAFLTENGYEVELLKILPNGKIDIAHLQAMLRNDTILLCVSAVDSELGAVQDLVALTQALQGYEHCHLHIDAAQAIGKIPVALPAEFSTMCFSPHKFYGLGGFGVLVKREGVVLEPLLHGGAAAHNALYRAGTPSPSHAAACFLALQTAMREQEKWLQSIASSREYVIEGLQRAVPTMRINSPADSSLYILNLSVAGIRGVEMQATLNAKGIAVSVKSACSADAAPSRPVFAVTGNKKNALESWRVSFSHHTTREELDALILAIQEAKV